MTLLDPMESCQPFWSLEPTHACSKVIHHTRPSTKEPKQSEEPPQRLQNCVPTARSERPSGSVMDPTPFLSTNFHSTLRFLYGEIRKAGKAPLHFFHARAT